MLAQDIAPDYDLNETFTKINSLLKTGEIQKNYILLH